MLAICGLGLIFFNFALYYLKLQRAMSAFATQARRTSAEGAVAPLFMVLAAGCELAAVGIQPTCLT